MTPLQRGTAPDAVLLILYENDLWDDRGKEASYLDLPLLDEDDALRLRTVARRAWRSFFPTPLERVIASNGAVRPADILDERFPWVLSADEVDRQFRRSAAYLDVFADELAVRGVPLMVTFVAIGSWCRPVSACSARTLVPWTAAYRHGGGTRAALPVAAAGRRGCVRCAHG